MFALILAGEAVFALPFHIARFFHPTVLEVFQISATELGAAQGVYGIVAMIAYFPGGPLADRFPARKLMAFSLWSTAAGGLYMATFPGYAGAALVWGFFGVTTILFFWAALIRATRDWGGSNAQGRAFGILDGGRGLMAAVLASVGAIVFTLAFPDGYSAASSSDKADALSTVIYGYTVVTALTGVFVWFALTDQPTNPSGPTNLRWDSLRRNFSQVFRTRAIWWQALIVICAYVGFKGLDNFTLFAVQGHGIDEVDAAQIAVYGSWMRPVAAILAGMLGDHFRVHRALTASFTILLLSHLFFATGNMGLATWIIVANFLVTCAAVFALRGLYFAVFEDANIPHHVTGTAVGLVSVVGYTPEIYVALVAGMFIDANPGLAGHQHFFLFQACFALLGIFASVAFARSTRAA